MTDEQTKRIKQIKKRLADVSEEWSFSANYPFYVDLKKPRTSLSKNDHKNPTYWHIYDGLFVANAKSDIKFLLNLIEKGE